MRISDDTLTSTPTGRSRRFAPWVALAVALALLVAVLVTKHGSTSGGSVPSESPTVASSAVASAPVPSASTSLVPVTVTGEVVPGLSSGTATVDSGHSDADIQGIALGWPRSVDGAVGAAMTYESHMGDISQAIDVFATKINATIFTPAGQKASALSPSDRAKLRGMFNLAPTGQVLTTGGKPDGSRRYYGGGEARYGAYQVRSATPSRVDVLVMVPIWMGVDKPTSTDAVKLYFRKVELIMVWADGDWKIDSIPWSSAVTPSDPRVSNQQPAALRAMLGEGWCLPADFTTSPLPGTVLTK